MQEKSTQYLVNKVGSEMKMACEAIFLPAVKQESLTHLNYFRLQSGA